METKIEPSAEVRKKQEINILCSCDFYLAYYKFFLYLSSLP